MVAVCPLWGRARRERMRLRAALAPEGAGGYEYRLSAAQLAKLRTALERGPAA